MLKLAWSVHVDIPKYQIYSRSTRNLRDTLIDNNQGLLEPQLSSNVLTHDIEYRRSTISVPLK